MKFSIKKNLLLSVFVSHLLMGNAFASSSQVSVIDYEAAQANTGVSQDTTKPLPTYLPSSSASVVVAQSVGIDPAGVPVQQKLSAVASQVATVGTAVNTIQTNTAGTASALAALGNAVTGISTALGGDYASLRAFALSDAVNNIMHSAFNEWTVINSVNIVFDPSYLSKGQANGALLTNGTWANTIGTSGGAAFTTLSPVPYVIRSGGRLLELFSNDPTNPNDDDYHLLMTPQRLARVLQAVLGISNATLAGYTVSNDPGTILTTVLDNVLGTSRTTGTFSGNPVFGGGTAGGPSPTVSTGSFGNISAGNSVNVYYGTHGNSNDLGFLYAVVQDLRGTRGTYPMTSTPASYSICSVFTPSVFGTTGS